MTFYSAGGFPFDDDMKPTLNTPAGQYAVDLYLQDKKVNHPEANSWGTPQMIPRIANGNVVACQYWDGTAKLNENPAKSVSYTHLRAHETDSYLVCRLLLEKK